MKHIKSLSEHLNENKSQIINEDFLEDCARERAIEINKLIKELDIQAGDWVNYRNQYNTAWHEIIDVYGYDEESDRNPLHYMLTCYRSNGSFSTDSREDLIRFSEISNVSKTIPENTECVMTSEGTFSWSRKNGSKIREILDKQKGISQQP